MRVIKSLDELRGKVPLKPAAVPTTKLTKEEESGQPLPPTTKQAESYQPEPTDSIPESAKEHTNNSRQYFLDLPDGSNIVLNTSEERKFLQNRLAHYNKLINDPDQTNSSSLSRLILAELEVTRYTLFTNQIHHELQQLTQQNIRNNDPLSPDLRTEARLRKQLKEYNDLILGIQKEIRSTLEFLRIDRTSLKKSEFDQEDSLQAILERALMQNAKEYETNKDLYYVTCPHCKKIFNLKYPILPFEINLDPPDFLKEQLKQPVPEVVEEGLAVNPETVIPPPVPEPTNTIAPVKSAMELAAEHQKQTNNPLPSQRTRLVVGGM